MSTQQFLDEFQQKMTRLNNVKRNIQANIAFKEQFTNELKGKLGQINQRIQSLSGLVTQLKTTSDTLQTQVNNNNNNVSEKDAQIQRLNEQIQQLQAEKEQIQNQFNQEKQQIQGQMQQKQQQIDNLEAQLRQVTQEKEDLNNEKTALQQELNSRGDTQAQHAQEIERLTQQAEQQQTELNQRIQECENRINELQQQLREKDEQHNQTIQQHTDQQNTAAQNAEGLQRQVTELTNQNNTLLEKIRQASEAIDSAANDLETISNAVPNATTKQEIDQLLSEIDASIQNITQATQGQAPVAQAQSRVAPNAPISLSDINSGQKINMSLDNLTTMLARKASQLRRNNPNSPNKYADALNQINSATSPEQISDIIMRSGISVKDGNVSGGKRKTKKNRKQKGGFTYKSSSRRKSITSVTGSKRASSRRTSR